MTLRYAERATLSKDGESDEALLDYVRRTGVSNGCVDPAVLDAAARADTRENVRLIGVVLGAAHASERDIHMAALLDQGFTTEDVPLPSKRDATRVAGRAMPSCSRTTRSASQGI